MTAPASARRRALLLDGSAGDDETGARVRAAVAAAAEASGWAPEAVTLREQRIGNCAGDFGCWVKHPGTCITDDDNRRVAAAIVHSDLVVYLGPVTFGGYSSALKRMVDHQIQNVSPQFQLIDGETHHRRRYARYPDLLAVGWQEQPDAAAAAVFRGLAARNAINFHAGASVADVVTATTPDAELLAAADGWLAALARHERLRARALTAAEAANTAEAAAAPSAPGPAPRRALLLVGSPRTRTSTSYALGRHLMERLAARGIDTETAHIHPAARSATRMAALLAAVDSADLVVLAFPLYIDSLPAPVIEAMERMAAHRSTRPTPQQRFVAVANCGFPEAAQNETALAICATFARQAGFAWAGGLALGGGEGLVHGAEVATLGGRARHVATALDIAADALAAGAPVPVSARELLARSAIPGWLYRLAGGIGWRLQAREFGVATELGRRPYAP